MYQPPLPGSHDTSQDIEIEGQVQNKVLKNKIFWLHIY